MQTNAGGGDVEAIDQESPAVASRKHRRFFQFTLRQILLLCALVGVLLCLLAPWIRGNLRVRRIQETVLKQQAAEADLREAVRKNDVSLARRKLAAGTDPNLIFDERSPNPQVRGPSVLNACIANGQIEMIELLLDFGADIERIERIPGDLSNPVDAGPPLFAAAGCKQPAEIRERMVRLLVARGANPRRLADGRWSAMDMAFETTDARMGDLWREFGLPYGPREMAAFNRLEELKAAVQESPEILERRYRSVYAGGGPTLLGIALSRGYREMSLFLIDAGAPLDVVEYGGYTMLHEAARGGDPLLIRLLVERGLDVNSKDRYLDTPLCDIAFNGKPEAIAALVELGADVNWQGIRTPLQHAVSSDRLDIVRLLLAAGADPLAPDVNGNTPLELARGKNPEIAKLLDQAAQAKRAAGK